MDPHFRRPEEILAYRTLGQVLASKPRDLLAVAPADSVLSALNIMANRNIGLVVVLDGVKLVGVLSERDCVRRVVLAKKPVDATPVTEVMTREVVTVDLKHTFGDCLRLMDKHAVRHLVVVDGGKVFTVLSIRDLLREAVTHHASIIQELEKERLTIFTSTA